MKINRNIEIEYDGQMLLSVKVNGKEVDDPLLEPYIMEEIETNERHHRILKEVLEVLKI